LSKKRKRYKSENRRRMHSHFPNLVTPVDEPGVVYEDVDLLEVLREEVEELCFRGRFEVLSWVGRFRRVWSGGRVTGSFGRGFKEKGCNREGRSEERGRMFARQISLCQPPKYV
jgi:hypothetical protein